MTRKEIVLLICIVIMVAVSISLVLDQSAWSTRCKAAGGVPITDRVYNRICFSKTGGILEVE